MINDPVVAPESLRTYLTGAGTEVSELIRRSEQVSTEDVAGTSSPIAVQVDEFVKLLPKSLRDLLAVGMSSKGSDATSLVALLKLQGLKHRSGWHGMELPDFKKVLQDLVNLSEQVDAGEAQVAKLPRSAVLATIEKGFPGLPELAAVREALTEAPDVVAPSLFEQRGYMGSYYETMDLLGAMKGEELTFDKEQYGLGFSVFLASDPRLKITVQPTAIAIVVELEAANSDNLLVWHIPTIVGEPKDPLAPENMLIKALNILSEFNQKTMKKIESMQAAFTKKTRNIDVPFVLGATPEYNESKDQFKSVGKVIEQITEGIALLHAMEAEQKEQKQQVRALTEGIASNIPVQGLAKSQHNFIQQKRESIFTYLQDFVLSAFNSDKSKIRVVGSYERAAVETALMLAEALEMNTIEMPNKRDNKILDGIRSDMYKALRNGDMRGSPPLNPLREKVLSGQKENIKLLLLAGGTAVPFDLRRLHGFLAGRAAKLHFTEVPA